MKKRIWLRVLIIVLAVLAVCIFALIALGGVLSHRGYSATVGRCLVTKDGSYMLIIGNSPVVLSDRSKGQDLFMGLESGDKILVVHDGICESYPGQTGVYECTRLESGDIGDIPEAVLQNLAELGWIDGPAGETPPETQTVPAGRRVCAFSAQYIRTDGYREGVKYPQVRIIRSTAELMDYYEENRDIFDLERRDQVYADSTIGFLDACDRYDSTYFENRVLVMVLLEEGSGSIRHKVTDVSLTDGKLVISIDTITPEIGTDDMAEWHILVEPEAGVDVESEAEIALHLDGQPVEAGVAGGKDPSTYFDRAADTIISGVSCEVMINGQIYCTVFRAVADSIDADVDVIGFISDESVDERSRPEKEGQANFSMANGNPYGIYQGGMVLYYQDKWVELFLPGEF